MFRLGHAVAHGTHPTNDDPEAVLTLAVSGPQGGFIGATLLNEEETVQLVISIAQRVPAVAAMLKKGVLPK